MLEKSVKPPNTPALASDYSRPNEMFTNMFIKFNIIILYTYKQIFTNVDNLVLLPISVLITKSNHIGLGGV